MIYSFSYMHIRHRHFLEPILSTIEFNKRGHARDTDSRRLNSTQSSRSGNIMTAESSPASFHVNKFNQPSFKQFNRRFHQRETSPLLFSTYLIFASMRLVNIASQAVYTSQSLSAKVFL